MNSLADAVVDPAPARVRDLIINVVHRTAQSRSVWSLGVEDDFIGEVICSGAPRLRGTLKKRISKQTAIHDCRLMSC